MEHPNQEIGFFIMSKPSLQNVIVLDSTLEIILSFQFDGHEAFPESTKIPNVSVQIPG